jgi:hypothetical protein
MRKFLFIFLFISLGISAQRIQNFNLVVTGSTVSVRFTMSEGSTCGGYNILHSTDSISYYPIYNYAGICGSSTVKQDFKYDHYSPLLDAVNYYKVELVGLELSPAKRVYVPSVPKVSMLLYPSVVTTEYDRLQIRIFNEPDKLYYGYVVSQFGRSMREVIVKTQNELAAIDVFNFPNGLYVLWLTDGDKLYSSKFVVNRGWL